LADLLIYAATALAILNQSSIRYVISGNVCDK
jgi:hypothetical protein